jgi:DNA-binding LacI/PurR family transcriptional regulator
MAQGRSHTLACLAPNLTDYTFASIIEGAEAEARQHGYFLLSSSAPDPVAFAALVEPLVLQRRVDGVLVINPYIDDRYRHLSSEAPVVLVGARSRDPRLRSISLDEQAAARVAVRHLASLGHERIAVIHGPLAEDCSQDRNAGYAAALQAAGLEPDPALVSGGDWSATSGYEAMGRLLRAGARFTALFAQNDRMAVGAIRALREAGRRVPDDVSVIGFDDIPLASYFDPPLTTMRQDMPVIGRLAARLLIQALNQPEAPAEHVNLPAELVVRSSTRRCEGR